MKKTITFSLFLLTTTILVLNYSIQVDNGVTKALQNNILASASVTPIATNMTEIITLKSGECAPPPITFAFPVGKDMADTNFQPPRIVLPPPDWIVQTSLPNPFSNLARTRSAVSAAYSAKQDHLWFSTADGVDNGIYQYDIKNESLTLFNQIENQDAYPISLIASNDDEIFGYNIAARFYVDEKHLYLLSKYDPASRKFIFVKDSALKKEGKYIAISDATTDTDNNLWLALEGKSTSDIVKFSSTKNKILHTYSLDVKNILSIAVAPNGNVWFIDNEYELYILNTSTGVAKPYTELYKYSNFKDNLLFDKLEAGELYFDRDGRLWISNLGWLEFNNEPPTFYRIIPSPVFIQDSSSPHNQYSWSRPGQIYQATNGDYWFSASGLIKLNWQTGTWCLLSSESSRISEDKDGNLWVVMFDKVYKLPSNK